ncbi:MAG: UvrD-helicase domain-containing protein [Candidatus Adiutrix sp.]|jgi:DNA helicase-2/ATP-dependent DNA helicase PcrA|nr:UvrD-helicase domain-containing protein [Candidatus Adiutrix sp.]
MPDPSPSCHYIDLHLHSRFSRATSPALNPASLSHWAGLKGLSLVGTGDLTHPAWLRELEENLTLRDDGFYSLKDEPGGPRFVPTGEVSAIYKQGGLTRKIHLVIIAPDLPAAVKFSRTLGALGNVESDGRPILGLSARQILEIALSTHPDMAVVPAHIWTPWFSLFGARSGFDHLEECFGDLSPHITALETGLSSDPAMNRLISALDSRALISSSDAHSPDKLGREATILNGPLTRANLAGALKGGPALGGTLEFFPEEGKYHLDGHLGCGPALTPAETKALGGLCPLCGRPVTIGVLHRVTELADRAEPPPDRLADFHLIPLAELLGQVFGQGPKSKRVTDSFHRLVNDFGSELNLLLQTSLSDLEEAAGPLLRLAVDRMRRGAVETVGGFDGQYGTVTALTAEDRAAWSGQGRLFESGPGQPKKRRLWPAPELSPAPAARPAEPPPPLALKQEDPLLDGLDDEQRRAVTSLAPALAVVAGPGSGKTRVLVRRAAWLLRENLADPETLLLTTFTRQAASELAPRLAAALPFRPEARQVRVTTLHGLAYALLKRQKPDWDLAPDGFLADLSQQAARKAKLTVPAFLNQAGLIKSAPGRAPEEAGLPGQGRALAAAFRSYQATLAANRWWDFDDLILGAAAGQEPGPFKTVLVDEFQDLSPAQFSFLKRLCPPAAESAEPGPRLTVIGDPDQSIYGFRGASPEIFDGLKIYPGLATVSLKANYRSTATIVRAGSSILTAPGRRPARAESGPPVVRAVLSNPRREAAYVAARLSAHLGVLKLGLGATSRQDAEVMPGLGLSDIAILFRLRSQGEAMAEALDAVALPWQMSGRQELTAVDHLDFTADKISLLTMHASKGLEFRLVFVIGAEEGLCPYLRPDEELTPARQGEEARLFFVALTRAKDRLYLTRAEKRRLYGQLLSGAPSPFWERLPARLCQDIHPKSRAARPKPAPTLFDF